MRVASFRRGAASAALALLQLLGGPSPTPALAQNERPDLAIEVLGLKAGSLREVRVRVTNVGQWWADRTSATVETVAPTAGNQDTEPVPDTGPKGDKETASEYEFTYTLAADCDGHEVKASLKPAKTFNGNTESNVANNTVGPTKLCAAKAQPKPNPGTQSGPVVAKPVGGVAVAKPEGILVSPVGDVAQANPEPIARTKTDPELIVLPEHMQPGSRRLRLEAVQRHLASDSWDNPPLIPLPGSGLCREGLVRQDALVGFYHRDSDDCYYAQVLQTSMRFELDDLRKLAHHLKRAVFEFDERIVVQRGPDGGPASLFTCVGYVGLLTVNPEGRKGLFPHEEDVQTGGFRSVDVTGQVRRLIANPEHDFGFMMGGLNEGNAEDEAACVSDVGFPRLILEYDVLGMKQ